MSVHMIHYSITNDKLLAEKKNVTATLIKKVTGVVWQTL